MEYIVTEEMEKTNHCLAVALEVVFSYLGISPNRIIPFHNFLEVDVEQNTECMDGILHSLIVEQTPEEFIEKFSAANIFMKHNYELTEEEIKNSLSMKMPILVMIDTYVCTWCNLYQKQHYEHICIISKEEKGEYEIIDPIFSKERINIKSNVLIAIGKSFFRIFDWDIEISYKEVFYREIVIMKKYRRDIVQSHRFEEILLSTKKYILENFQIREPASMLIANFFKQFAEGLAIYNRFVFQCTNEDEKIKYFYKLIQNSIKELNHISYSFIRLGVCEKEKKDESFEKVVNSIRLFNNNEVEKKIYLDWYFSR